MFHSCEITSEADPNPWIHNPRPTDSVTQTYTEQIWTDAEQLTGIPNVWNGTNMEQFSHLFQK